MDDDISENATSKKERPQMGQGHPSLPRKW